ncbi:MAG: PTS sugar transporter subunit IIA [Candidatus Cloacimonetes bacterium]|nr:PTS sugar transporter subunit IIA [Candidatus Cloacimonadota bacterium]
MFALFEHIKAWFFHETALIVHPNPLFVLSFLLIVGYAFTMISKRLHIPTVTGQIIGGILVGRYFLNLFSSHSYEGFSAITSFALGFIGLTIGSHLNFRKLHNAGKRIFLITFADAIITSTIVFVSLFYVAHLSFQVSLLVSAIAITTAPGSTIHIVQEKKAKGIFTKTLLAVVALNNVVTILVFYTVFHYIAYLDPSTDISIVSTFFKPLLMLLESIAIGGSVGFLLIHFTEKRKSHISFLVMVILAVIVTVGLSETIHISGILSSLILGIVITNYSKHKKMLFSSFKDIETEVFSLFFVLAGTHFDLQAMRAAGFAGIILVVSRFIGKTVGPYLGSTLAGSIQIIRDGIKISLYPIAGLAIGLVFMTTNNSKISIYSSEIAAIVLTAVIVNELLGPIFTGKAIKRAGEENKNRLRLMDFIQEEFITISLSSNNKWEALGEMTEFIAMTHKLSNKQKTIFHNSIMEREKDFSTGLGNNLAIPHGVLEKGPKIIGAIGVSAKGIHFDALDEKPVNIIFMLGTPMENFERQHLMVLSNVAKLFGKNPRIREDIINSKSAEEVYAILQTKEVEELNPFFED